MANGILFDHQRSEHLDDGDHNWRSSDRADPTITIGKINQSLHFLKNVETNIRYHSYITESKLMNY